MRLLAAVSLVATLAAATGCSPDEARLISTIGPDQSGDAGLDATTSDTPPPQDISEGDTIPLNDAGYSDVVIPPDVDQSKLQDPDPTPVSTDDYTSADPLEQFVLNYAVHLCNKLFECADRNVTRYAFFNGMNSPATCMQYYQSHFSPKRLSAAAQEGRLQFTEGNAASCLSSVDQMSCEDFGAKLRLMDSEFWTCRDTLTGQVADGDRCYASPECAGQEICVPRPGEDTCEGVCQPVQSTCGDTECEVFEEYCDYNDNTCKPLKQAGASCTTLSECDWHLDCALNDANPTCKALSEATGVDEVCNPNEVFCSTGTFCAQYWAAGPPACRRLKAEGGTCPPGSSSGGCIATTYCAQVDGQESNRCEALKTADQGCLSDFECASGRCVADKCVAPDTPCVTP